MQAAAPGLRERKKAETRAALRAAAVRLFLGNPNGRRGPRSAVELGAFAER
ncbi:hypothetical protein ABT124_32240 [Streptomyces sp. NPDC001982]|uniref:hypothetical protein n=1 Tax=Streptomyces sp. NPDC001982 TaxID=3154405 RepID=UPI003331BF6A